MKVDGKPVWQGAFSRPAHYFACHVANSNWSIAITTDFYHPGRLTSGKRVTKQYCVPTLVPTRSPEQPEQGPNSSSTFFGNVRYVPNAQLFLVNKSACDRSFVLFFRFFLQRGLRNSKTETKLTVCINVSFPTRSYDRCRLKYRIVYHYSFDRFITQTAI